MVLVPIFDSTDIFYGKHPDRRLDFSTVSKVCNARKTELVRGDLVACVHSTGVNSYRGSNIVQFGIYFAVLLARKKDAVAVQKR